MFKYREQMPRDWLPADQWLQKMLPSFENFMKISVRLIEQLQKSRSLNYKLTTAKVTSSKMCIHNWDNFFSVQSSLQSPNS